MEIPFSKKQLLLLIFQEHSEKIGISPGLECTCKYCNFYRTINHET